MALGKQIRFHRDRQGLTLEALSERSGVDVGTIHALEKRDSKRSEHASAIARGLGITFEQLEDEAFSPVDSKVIDVSARVVNDTPALPPVAAASESETPPDGYVRLEHWSPEPALGRGHVIDAPPHVVQRLDVLEQWVRQKIGTTSPTRIKVLTARGHSMRPTILDQDLVFVDVEQQSIDVPGIYVIDVAGRLLLKKALIRSDGTLVLRSDNQDEFPDEELHDLKKSAGTIIVAGKVMAWWTLRQ